jgi:predicted flap endonuclease-1-like 5' DNA nuclease
MAKVIDIEGIGEKYALQLNEIGILTTDHLLSQCCSPEGRKAVAEKTGISGKLILEWANRADLFRIKGVGEEYSDLLEHAGVDTVPELARRNPENLLAAMTEVQEKKRLVRKMPVLSQVTSWIEQAKELPRVLTY